MRFCLIGRKKREAISTTGEFYLTDGSIGIFKGQRSLDTFSQLNLNCNNFKGVWSLQNRCENKPQISDNLDPF
jgi:hypothetical protein